MNVVHIVKNTRVLRLSSRSRYSRSPLNFLNVPLPPGTWPFAEYTFPASIRTTFNIFCLGHHQTSLIVLVAELEMTALVAPVYAKVGHARHRGAAAAFVRVDSVPAIVGDERACGSAADETDLCDEERICGSDGSECGERCNVELHGLVERQGQKCKESLQYYWTYV